MKLWLSIPHDPLIFRDGSPFTAEPGAEAHSLPFPFPSTTAGAVRTLAGTDPQTGKFQTDLVDELLQKTITGPLLVEIEQINQIKNYLFPAPADALLLKSNKTDLAERYYLHPLKLAGQFEAEIDLEGAGAVGPKKLLKEKPHPSQPAFWRSEPFFNWLEAPQDGTINLSELGHDGPQREHRLHPTIDPTTQTTKQGYLFRTSGLEFFPASREKDSDPVPLSSLPTLGLAIQTDANLREEIGFLGGERRIVIWKNSDQQLPACPCEIRNQILKQKACRLVLLTPGYFENGHLPSFRHHDTKPSVKAAAVRRYQTVSGWDYAKRQPKPTRRLAPAGSVYFLRFKEQVKEDELEKFIEQTWMKAISDDEQLKRDGFGLAVLGTWNGQSEIMEI